MFNKDNNYNFFYNENRKWYGGEILVESILMFGLLFGMLGFFFFALITNNIIYVLDFDTGFPDSSSMFAENLIHLYNTIWIILVFVVFFILVILFRTLYLFGWKNFVLNNAFFVSFINFGLDYLLIIKIFLLDEEGLNLLLNRINAYDTKNINLNLWYDLNRKEFLTISDISEYRKLEILWCLLPILSLLFIATPTFSLIFSLDSFVDPVYTVKIIGRQWYWNYSFDVNLETNSENFDKINDELKNNDNVINNVSIENIEKYDLSFSNNVVSLDFDSVMISEEDLIKGTHRLLEVDNRLVLPIGVPIRLLITSADVLHSWAVPALGIKVDAVPGRLNQFIIEIKRPGIFYGQCSELCGPLHGFMPIVIQAVSLSQFENWLLEQ